MHRLIFILMLTLTAPAPVSAQVQGQVIKVLSYNIHHAENMKGEVDIQGIANIILATNPDLVALQEVDSSTNRVKKANQLKQPGRSYRYVHLFRVKPWSMMVVDLATAFSPATLSKKATALHYRPKEMAVSLVMQL